MTPREIPMTPPEPGKGAIGESHISNGVYTDVFTYENVGHGKPFNWQRLESRTHPWNWGSILAFHRSDGRGPLMLLHEGETE